MRDAKVKNTKMSGVAIEKSPRFCKYCMCYEPKNKTVSQATSSQTSPHVAAGATRGGGKCEMQVIETRMSGDALIEFD